MAPTSPETSERESLKVAEASRQQEWHQPSFMRELFLGNFRLDLVHPYPLPGAERPEFTAYYDEMKRFLREDVDSVEIDATGEYPEQVIETLRRMGAFGMKIPKEYGGLGFTNGEYQKVMQLLGSVDGNIVALLSAHQSIGVPQPLKLFGSRELKKKYLPRCARGEISAFALTEPNVGSDPTRLSTTAEKSADGTAYVLNGTKLWCTNGTIAKLLVVMAVDPKTRKISAFVVETAWAGVKVEHRSHFMGLRALANGVISFKDVVVPVENLRPALHPERLGGDGQAVPGDLPQVGIRARAMGQARRQARGHRAQDLVHGRAHLRHGSHRRPRHRDGGPRRLRHPPGGSGGQGVEHRPHVGDRGRHDADPRRARLRDREEPEGARRAAHRRRAHDARLPHQQDLRGLLRDHAPLHGPRDGGQVYAGWYPTRWLGWGRWPRYSEFGALATHLRFVERSARKLARASFHGMLRYQAKLQNKQAFLFRLVDVANELFAMAATVARARALAEKQRPEAAEARHLADLFCRISRRRVQRLFDALWDNDDVQLYRAGVDVLDGRHEWLEKGILGLGTPEAPRDREAAEAEAKKVAVGVS